MKKLIFAGALFAVFSAHGQEVYFTPGDHVQEHVIENVAHSQKEVLVQAYGFSSKPIVKALCDAAARGIQVKVVADKSNLTSKGSAIGEARNCGIEVYIDGAHKIAHNKVIVIDESILITGSYNYTASAEFANAENLIVIRNAKTALQYKANFAKHLGHSEAMQVK